MEMARHLAIANYGSLRDPRRARSAFRYSPTFRHRELRLRRQAVPAAAIAIGFSFGGKPTKPPHPGRRRSRSERHGSPSLVPPAHCQAIHAPGCARGEPRPACLIRTYTNCRARCATVLAALLNELYDDLLDVQALRQSLFRRGLGLASSSTSGEPLTRQAMVDLLIPATPGAGLQIDVPKGAGLPPLCLRCLSLLPVRGGQRKAHSEWRTSSQPAGASRLENLPAAMRHFSERCYRSAAAPGQPPARLRRDQAREQRDDSLEISTGPWESRWKSFTTGP